MRTKLLKKVRKLHPIYFNVETKKYTYIPKNVFYPNNHEYESSKNYKDLLKSRRIRILKDARLCFFKCLFCYKRKRIIEIL